MIKPKSSAVTRLAVVGGLALGLAAPAFAQSASPEAMPPTHAHAAMHRGAFLRGLDLTEAQRDQVFKIFHDQAPAARERMKAVRQAREQLAQLVRAASFDPARARQIADAEAKALSDLTVMRAQSMSRVRALLTPEQQQKFDQRLEQRGHRGRRG